MSALVIYALRVNGGILALSQMPGRDGDFAADLDHLHDWRPAIVMTVTTQAELVQFGAATLGPDLQAMGTRWVHLPVEDFGVPDPKLDFKWPSFSRPALAALSGGGRVLVHCKGGCGRSGMVVLRLMIEAGEDPIDALTRLRALRPCAVESLAQLDWAKKGQQTRDDGAADPAASGTGAALP